jgi:catechol 2,3-dioxygenase-like lactoylglutathione lyase family enzyme
MRATEIGDDRLVPDAGAPIDVHVYVEVSDLDRALAFYVGGLGLRELRRFTPRWVELAGARVPIHLLARPEPEFRAGAATLRRDYLRHWTPVHLDFVVDSLQTAVARAVAAGGVLDRDIVDHRYWRMANLADPFGNGVDLIEFAEGGYEAFVSRAPTDLPTGVDDQPSSRLRQQPD